ncbi:divalent cation tolerance protein CutA [Candidatus Woesearchaeota archaeon]|nr:divalent cation tolerance protein CutA [Candidatus Woesearchaeota archaeon]
MRPILIYVTAKEAKIVAEHLLLQKLVSCVNIVPIKSMYWQDGDLKDEKEALLIIKTFDKKFKKIEKEIKEKISKPRIIEIPITNVNKEYLKWSEEQIL